jgi:YVTN family beta-propeller protein
MRHFALIFLSLFSISIFAQAPVRVGDKVEGGTIVSTQQLIRPAGESIQFDGRPVDLCLSPDGKTAYLKGNRGVTVIDLANWAVKQELPLTPGASMHGIVATSDGKHVYLTDSAKSLIELDLAADGKVSVGRKIELKASDRGGSSQSAGLALTKDGRLAVVCMALFNQLGIVDLETGEVTQQTDTGLAPYDVVLSPDEKLAYVSNWAGRRVKEGDKTAKTAGTPIPIDNRSIASTGTVSIIDLTTKQTVAEIATGLHPSDLELSRDGKMLYVANANSDTITVIDTNAKQVTETISVRPDPTLAFGSAPNAIALSEDGKRLYVANGGNNAIAVVDLGAPSKVAGYIPTGWYPGAVVLHGDELLIANVKGIGSRMPKELEKGWHVKNYAGTMTRVKVPSSDELATYTKQALADAHVPESLRAWEKAQSDQKPLPVPKRVGEPSLFEHVIYVIKENRTYDQVLGDIGKGNSDPKLCVFGKDVSPNHHALADQFVLLDNFYCNGVISADGHAWATEGFASDYWEKSFGGFTRIYFQGDATTPVSSGFIWDNVLLHGLSFRNYGEKVFPEIGRTTWFEMYKDFTTKANKVKIEYPMTFEALRPYTCPDYPGWNMRISDQQRMESFLREFKGFEAKGELPNMLMVYLPEDHTGGMSPNFPKPECMVADNDLALGKLVDAVSHSKFWAKTCIFVIEDDPQAGFDHVDGHRSLCLVASPYTKRGAVVSNFYNQTSVLHTMELILGIPPMNQHDAMAPVMHDCFTETADTTPYTCLKNNIPLDTPNKGAKAGDAKEEANAAKFAALSEAQNLSEPDRIDDDTFNRIIWFSVKGNQPYPAEFAGPHGKGLKSLKLKFDGAKVKDDDDD